jgi:ABC-type uncharacterized transport system substrate-binding protein
LGFFNATRGRSTEGTGRSRLFAAVVLLTACAFAAVPVSNGHAHPHVWIDASVTLVLDRGRIVAARVGWVFDEFYSVTLLRAFDADRSQSFSPAETRRLRAEAFENVSGFGYFTHITVDGKKLLTQRVEDFSAAVRKGRVIYRFTVPFPTPVDPAKNRVTVSAFDETYYVDMTFAQVEIRHGEVQTRDCRVDMQEDRSNPLYFGAAFPQLAVLTCSPK